MPPGTCHYSARLCAVVYDELQYRGGVVTVAYADGEVRDFNHSWCVDDGGDVVDLTMPREPEPGAAVTYREGFKGDYTVPWPDEFVALEAKMRPQAAAAGEDAKRWEIERYGRLWQRRHEKELGRPYRPPWDRRYGRAGSQASDIAAVFQ